VNGRVRHDDPGICVYPVPLAEASRATPNADPANLALRYMNDEIAHQQRLLDDQERSMAAQASMSLACGDFADLTSKEWQTANDRRIDLRSRVARLQAEPQRRWSAGFACFCFVWVGAPLAIRLRNRDFLTSFFICFLPILLVYYPLMIYGVAGTKTGSIPPVSAWAGDVLLLFWGGWILNRVVRY
jgi:lipopolysaccharide export system permease protein